MSETVTITLSCPSCGAKLEITPDIERFICLHCGTQQMVRRGGGLLSIQPLVQGIERVQFGTDRTAAELAIKRLTDEIRQAQKEVKDWQNLSLDDINPPPLAEKIWPIVAVSAVFLGFFAINEVGNVACGLILLGPLLAAVYFFVRAKRRNAAQRRVNSEVEAWSTDVAKLQKLLEKNRRIVNA